MLKLIKEHYRRKALKEASAERSARQNRCQTFLNLRGISSVGFLYTIENEDDLETLTLVVEEFRKWNIPFKGLVIEGRRIFKNEQQREEFAQECSEDDLFFAHQGLFNWIGVMAWQESDDSGAIIDEFFGNHFDFFVNLNINKNFTADYLTILADADFIAGMHNNSKLPYSLILECAEEDFSYPKYISSLFGFLNRVNSNTVR